MGKSSSSKGGSSTPARNNYAAPHTPIASAKRPRSSIDKSMLSPGGAKPGLPTTPLDANKKDGEDVTLTPKTPGTASRESVDGATLPMSPMHSPKPIVARKGKDGQDVAHHGSALPALEGIAEGEIAEEEGGEGSWVGRQVDALFSPVLNFLGGEEGEEGLEGGQAHAGPPKEEGDDSAPPAATDGDVAMEDREQQVPQVSDTSHTTSHEEEEEEVVDEVHRLHEQEEEEGEHLVEDDGSSQGSEEDEDEFNPYVFIKSLPAYELVAPLRPPIALPPKAKDSPPISLVLDLDETLVHCTVEPIDDADLVFPVVFHGVTYQVHVRLRPHLFQFLEKIRGKYEVIVFTASQKVYANELLNLIDPGKFATKRPPIRNSHVWVSNVKSCVCVSNYLTTEGKYIHHRMFRESCLAVEGNFLKDLTVLGRDLAKSVLVDNSPHAFGYQVDNGIPIESWFDDPDDTELLKLERFLRTLHPVDDVREVVRQKFQTYRLVEES